MPADKEGQSVREVLKTKKKKKGWGCSFSMGLFLLVVCVTDRSHGRERREERAAAQANNRDFDKKEEYHMSGQSEQTGSNEQASITFGLSCCFVVMTKVQATDTTKNRNKRAGRVATYEDAMTSIT